MGKTDTVKLSLKEYNRLRDFERIITSENILVVRQNICGGEMNYITPPNFNKRMVEINKTLSKELDELKSKFSNAKRNEERYAAEIDKNKTLTKTMDSLISRLKFLEDKIKVAKWYNLGDLKKEIL